MIHKSNSHIGIQCNHQVQIQKWWHCNRCNWMKGNYIKNAWQDVPNKCWQKNFNDGTKWEPENFRSALLRVLEELDKLIDERALKYEELRIKESEAQAIKEIAKLLKESEIQQQESLVIEGTTLEANLSTGGRIMEACLSINDTVIEACLITEGAVIEAYLLTKGATLEACLVNKGITLNDNTGVMESSGTASENSCKETPFSISEDENRKSDKESSNSEGNDANADIGPSYNSDTVSEVAHDMLENMFAHEIQSHEQPESISDTYEVNKNNSNIISDIPNMDFDRNKEEHDYVDYEQQRVFFASLINNLKCDVENVMRLIVKIKRRMPY
ncbi:hypothetical protein Tco_0969417 [Tanacetum coccineum]